jgi:hypothetical protein
MPCSEWAANWAWAIWSVLRCRPTYVPLWQRRRRPRTSPELSPGLAASGTSRTRPSGGSEVSRSEAQTRSRLGFTSVMSLVIVSSS